MPSGLKGLCIPLLALISGGAGCAGAGTAAAPRDSGRFEEIRDIRRSQVDAWNHGDIDAFMDAYWRSSDLTFSAGGQVVRGWQATRDRYRRKYPNRQAMGRLSFSGLEVRSLGSDATLVLGRWRLERDEAVGGVFTLVWRRIDGRWQIVHDHTSAEVP